MFVRLFLISTVVSVMCAWTAEPTEAKTLPALTVSQPATDLLKTEYRRAVQQVPTTRKHESTSTEKSTKNESIVTHASVHPGMMHPKKRATSTEDDHRSKPLPGCCG